MTDLWAQWKARHAERRPVRPLIVDPIVASLALLLVVSIFFRAFPSVDLWFSRLFYDPQLGFPVGRLGAFTGLRTIADWLLKLAVGVLVLAFLVKLALPSRPTPIAPQKIVFLLLVLAMGPGLLVNGILKQFWGRPRPRMVDLFGGSVPYVPVWRISHACAANCSLASGEAATVVWFVALALVAPAAWRRSAVVTAVAFAVVVSLNRIAFGAHFLSDVLVAWGLTLFLIALLHRLMIEEPPAWLANDALEARFAEWGEKLHRAVTPHRR